MEEKTSEKNKSTSENNYVTMTTTYTTEQFGFDPLEVSKTWVRSMEEYLQMQKKQLLKKIESLDEKLLKNARRSNEEPKKAGIEEKMKEPQLSIDDNEFSRLSNLLVPQIILPQVKTVSRHVEPDGKNVIITIEKFFTGEGTFDDPKTTYTRTTTETFYEDSNQPEENLTPVEGKEGEKITKDQPQGAHVVTGETRELITTGDENAKTSAVTITKNLSHGGKEKTVTNTTVEKLPDGMTVTKTKTTRHVTYPDGFEESERKLIIIKSSGDEALSKEIPPEENKKAEQT